MPLPQASRLVQQLFNGGTTVPIHIERQPYDYAGDTLPHNEEPHIQPLMKGFSDHTSIFGSFCGLSPSVRECFASSDS